MVIRVSENVKRPKKKGLKGVIEHLFCINGSYVHRKIKVRLKKPGTSKKLITLMTQKKMCEPTLLPIQNQFCQGFLGFCVMNKVIRFCVNYMSCY